MVDIFISYRREDEPYGAALLDAVLSANFGSEIIFRAPKSIEPGDDFEHRIFEAIRKSSVLLAVIGPNWVGVDASGRRRIDDPQDFVRREIREALTADVRVIPVLMNASRLAPADLPEDIRPMARAQDVRVHFRHSHVETQTLVTRLAELIPDLTVRQARRTRPAPTPVDQEPGWHGPASVTVRANTVQSVQNGPVDVAGDFVIKSGRD